jgi:hypothetical protein
MPRTIRRCLPDDASKNRSRPTKHRAQVRRQRAVSTGSRSVAVAAVRILAMLLLAMLLILVLLPAVISAQAASTT